MNLFIASHTVFERPAKIANALKKAGHNVILLYCNEPADSYLKTCFTECYRVENIGQVDDLIQKYGIKLIHIFSTFTDPLALYLIGGKKVKTIYDYKDIFEGLLSLNFDNEYYRQQEFLITQSDYVCFRDFQLHDYLKLKKLDIKNKFYYPDLVWSNQPAINKINQIKKFNKNEIHLVTVGNYSIEKLNPEQSGNGCLLTIKSLLDQGFFVHFYPTNPAFKDKEIVSDYLDLVKSNSKFTIHPVVNISDLHDELYLYDFAFHLFQGYYFNDCKTYLNDSLFRSSVATRIMDYIGANLPIIYSKNWQQINMLNKKYKFGLSIDKKDFQNLNNIISNIDVHEMRRNLLSTSVYYLNSNRWIDKILKKYINILSENQ